MSEWLELALMGAGGLAALVLAIRADYLHEEPPEHKKGPPK